MRCTAKATWSGKVVFKVLVFSFVFIVGGSKTSEDGDGRILVEAWTLEFADDTSGLIVAKDES